MGKLTLNDFIKISKEKHGDRYDYSLVNYKNTITKVNIICKEHGIFNQTPSNHSSNEAGCPLCGLEIQRNFLRKDTSYFIKSARKVHKDKYDYSLVDYKQNKILVKIICPIHGEFEQTPNSHLTNGGCRKCGREKADEETRQKRTDNFIFKANTVHNNKFDYTKMIYINNRTKIIITCPDHGDLEVIPNNHVDRKQGCYDCYLRDYNSDSRSLSGWSYTKWINTSKGSKNFDSFKVYILKCWSDTETFYKIGKTFQKVSKRYDKGSLPYNYKIIKILESNDGLEICKLEMKKHMENKEYKYKPKVKFGGYRECYKKVKGI